MDGSAGKEFACNTRDKEDHHVTIKGPIQQDITFATTYALNLEKPKYIKRILTDLKGEIAIL